MTTSAADAAPGALWRVPGADIPIDVAAVRFSILNVAERAAELIAGIVDVGAPVPDSDWTVGDAATHLVVGARAFTAAVEGRLDGWGTPEGESVVRQIFEVDEPHEPTALARQLDGGVHAWFAATAQHCAGRGLCHSLVDPDRNHHLGTIACLILGELVIHGHDLAMAVGRPWPVDPEDARLIIAGVFPAKIPVIVNREATSGVRARYRLDVDGGPTFVVQFDDGVATVHPGGPSAAVDCHVSGDATRCFCSATAGRRQQSSSRQDVSTPGDRILPSAQGSRALFGTPDLRWGRGKRLRQSGRRLWRERTCF